MPENYIGKIGEKTIISNKLNWDKIRHDLLPKFYDAGITSCELMLPQCKRGMFLGFGHAQKRRNIYTIEDMERVILICNQCHQFIEALGSKGIITMAEIVDRVIELRGEI